MLTRQEPDQSPYLSVIIPAHNGAATIGAQLDALAAQTYEGGWELIVVDNRSTDGTAALVAQYCSKLAQLRLIRADQRRGRCYACNAGAAAARGAVLVFCDADDVAAPTWLAALAEAARTHVVLAGAIDVARLNQGAPWRPKPFTSARQPALAFLPYAIGSNLAVARRAFETVGGYDESVAIGGDIDLSWRLQLAGYPLTDVPDAVMYYRYRPTLHDLWRQVVAYGEAHAMLYARFAAHGMPPSALRDVLTRCLWLVRNLPALGGRDERRRAEWVYYAASRWGRLRGSLRYRVWYP